MLASLAVLSGLAIPGCDRGGQAVSAAKPTDAERAERIVALLPFAADQLIEMGVTPAGVPRLDGEQPESWQSIPTVALDHSAGPNLEQLIAADPDLIVTSSVYAQFVPAMERSTGSEALVMDVDSVASVPEHIRTLGELAGRPQRASELVERIERHSRPASPESPVSTLAIFGTPHAFYAFLPDSYLGDLVSLAGGELITGDMQSHGVFRGLAPLSMETVVDRDPEQLIVVFHGPEQTARAMIDRDPLWSGLRAVREDRVAFLRDDLYAMRPGSEMPRAIDEIKRIIAQARLARETSETTETRKARK